MRLCFSILDFAHALVLDLGFVLMLSLYVFGLGVVICVSGLPSEFVLWCCRICVLVVIYMCL